MTRGDQKVVVDQRNQQFGVGGARGLDMIGYALEEGTWRQYLKRDMGARIGAGLMGGDKNA